MVAAQVAMTVSGFGSPAWSQQVSPPALPALPSPTAPTPAPSVQIVQVAPSAAATPTPLVTGVPLRIFDVNKLDAPRPMRLVRVDGDPGVSACEAPSTTPCVAAPGRYRVMGRGMRDTQEFDLAGAAPVDVGVDRGSKAAFYTGIGVMGAGGVLGLTGGLLLAVTPSQTWTSRAGYGGDVLDERELYRVYGWTFIVLGAAALITGIVLTTRHSSSTATVTPSGGT